jgi:hypothetical protein
MKIPIIPHDKAQHFIYGALTSLLVILLMIAASPWWSAALNAAPFIGVLSAAFLGIVTEVRQDVLNEDAFERGDPPPHSVDSHDAYITAVGGLTPVLPLMLLWLLSKFL